MTYKDQLDTLSKTILEFDREFPEDLSKIVKESSLAQVKIYQKNLFFGAYEILSEDFIGIRAHLEDGNFRFLARKYLLESQIRTPNIFEFSQSFVPYLESQLFLHQDNYLVPLGRVDLLYNHGLFQNSESLTLPKGITRYWQELIQGNSPTPPPLDFNEKEFLKVIEIEGERHLKRVDDLS